MYFEDECHIYIAWAKYKYRLMHPEIKSQWISIIRGFTPVQDRTWGGTAVCALFGGTIYMRGDIIACQKTPLPYLQLQ